MLAMPVSTSTDGSLANFAPATDGLLSTMLYHSRAVNPLSGADLHELARAAQVRNRAESITGLMLYDNAHFFQWLEGPAESLTRVMRSIRDDPRHTQIEVLNDQPIAQRRFGDWSMKLATSGRRAVKWQQEVIKPPRAMIKDLRRDPDAAAALLIKFAPVPTAGNPVLDTMPHPFAGEPMSSVFRALIVTRVVPELAARRAPSLPAAVDAQAEALAHLLIASDHRAALEFINEVRGNRPFLGLYPTLFEPAARHLGDLAHQDHCTEFDVTFGLCQLQTALRISGARHPPLARAVSSVPAILVAPEPGELHALSAILAAEVLWNAGWAPRCEYPAGDEALQDLLASNWFDALDLSLSAAFCREHWLPRVTDTIAGARRASRNPTLAIVVSGRIFAEQGDACRRVGADRAVATALHAKRAILHAMTDLQNASRPCELATAIDFGSAPDVFVSG